MKSNLVGSGENILASQMDAIRDDASGGGSLLAHQQLGALALGTLPSNGQVIPIVINGTTITLTAVSVIGSTPNNILIPSSALAKDFAANVAAFCRRPDITNANQVAASGANQTLLQYVGWALPTGGTTISPFSLNNSSNAPLSTFNITGITVTSGTWTANTMRLYVEAGIYYIGQTQVKFLGGSSPTVTAPGANPRIDVLTIDTSGVLAWTTGSENASPTVPSYPSGKYPICELYNVVSETALYDNQNQQASQGYIQADVRPITNLLYINNAGQIASGIVLFDPGSDAQGDVFYWNGGLQRLPAGTNNQVLITQGAAANPKWGSLPALNILDDELITAGGAAFTTASFAAKGYLRVVIMLQAQTQNKQLAIQFNSDNANHYQDYISINGAAPGLRNTRGNLFAGTQATDASSPAMYVLDIENYSGSFKVVRGYAAVSGSNVAGQLNIFELTGIWNGTAAQITTITIGADGNSTFTTNDRIIVYGN